MQENDGINTCLGVLLALLIALGIWIAVGVICYATAGGIA